MTTATIKTSFDAAHILQGYAGKCGNLHGHTYKLEVTVSSDEANKMGMVVDYNTLKPVVREIVEEYDHAFLYGSEDASELEDVCLFLGLKIKYIRGYSSTENLVRQIADELETDIIKKRRPWHLVKVRLSETDSTYAELEIDALNRI